MIGAGILYWVSTITSPGSFYWILLLYSICYMPTLAIVNAVARRFPKVKDRFVLDMLEIGNTVSSTIPLLLEKTLVQRDVRRVLISGFGVGLSWASTILTRRDDQ